jgi:hypothetical protein
VPLSSGVDSVAATNQLGAGSYSKLYFPSYDGTGCGNGTLIARSGGIELGRLDRPCPGRTWEIKTPSPS